MIYSGREFPTMSHTKQTGSSRQTCVHKMTMCHSTSRTDSTRSAWQKHMTLNTKVLNTQHKIQSIWPSKTQPKSGHGAENPLPPVWKFYMRFTWTYIHGHWHCCSWSGDSIAWPTPPYNFQHDGPRRLAVSTCARVYMCESHSPHTI